MSLTASGEDDLRQLAPAGRQLTLSAPVTFLAALLAFAVSAQAAFWLQAGSEDIARLGFSGFAVPDALSLDASVRVAWTEGWNHLPNISTFLGTVLLYFPMMFLGSAYVFSINVILLSASASLFYSLLTKITRSGSCVGTWLICVVMIATNLYIVACMPYVNKEIPLIFLTSVAIHSIIGRRWLVAGLAIFLCYWFRDGYALILALVMAVTLCRRMLFATGGALAMFGLLFLFLAFPIQSLSSVDASLQRNVAIGAETIGDKFTVLGAAPAYVVRVLGNALNLGLRPQMAEIGGNIYLLGVGYWQFGIVLVAGLIWGVRNLLARDIARGSLALVILTTLIGISYGTFVQPRYMMPLIFILSLGLSDSRLGRYIAIPASIVFPLLFLILGALPPLAGA